METLQKKQKKHTFKNSDDQKMLCWGNIHFVSKRADNLNLEYHTAPVSASELTLSGEHQLLHIPAV